MHTYTCSPRTKFNASKRVYAANFQRIRLNVSVIIVFSCHSPAYSGIAKLVFPGNRPRVVVGIRRLFM